MMAGAEESLGEDSIAVESTRSRRNEEENQEDEQLGAEDRMVTGKEGRSAGQGRQEEEGNRHLRVERHVEESGTRENEDEVDRKLVEIRERIRKGMSEILEKMED